MPRSRRTQRNNANRLQRLPLELRNRIYEYVVGDITSLTVLAQSTSLMRAQLKRNLPLCLRLNRQIVEEAANAVFHHTLLVVEDLVMRNPVDVSCVVPPGMMLKSVRRLEVTQPQMRYDRDLDDATASPLSSVYDLVKRCPQLRELTIRVETAVLFTTPNDPSKRKTAQELAATTGFGLVFQHEKLEKLSLGCNSPESPYFQRNGPPHCDFVVPFVDWLEQETRARGGRVTLDVDITPDLTYDPSHNTCGSECLRSNTGCIRYVWWYDCMS
ncbi:hypothetical protein CC86DRAFT_367123 [Ophiobolus disseminans]|uniref:F-box domain-containing protein n=1 Tax=Ophiobolus disseminans TaxID=1469910 RepID=A0A6A7AAU8_9PLEO|nr:hypothetical protein CC86DRAFT_367123 [Ophiobolus disseminans]